MLPRPSPRPAASSPPRSIEEQRAERIAKFANMNLYIKNLEDDVDDDKLREEFTPFGTITSCKVRRHLRRAARCSTRRCLAASRRFWLCSCSAVGLQCLPFSPNR